MNKSNIVFIIIIVTLSLTLFKSCNNTVKAYQERDNYKILVNDTIKHYSTKIIDTVASKESLLVTEREIRKGVYYQNDSLKSVIKKFKSVSSATTIKYVIKHDTLIIPYENPIETPFEREFSFENNFYKIKGLSTNLGTRLDVHEDYAELNIVIGKKKKWFKTTYSADAYSNNPNLNINKIESQQIVEKRKWFVVSAGVGYDFLRGDIIVGINAGIKILEF